MRKDFELKILNGTELLKLVKSNPKNKLQLFGSDKQPKSIKYFNSILRAYHTEFVVITQQGLIVGIGEIQDPVDDGVSVITHISVDPKYQNLGVASKIAEEIFKYAKNKGWELRASSYEPEGMKYLKPVLQNLSRRYHVGFWDRDSKGEYEFTERYQSFFSD